VSAFREKLADAVRAVRDLLVEGIAGERLERTKVSVNKG
jgi:hypothetical protein